MSNENENQEVKEEVETPKMHKDLLPIVKEHGEDLAVDLDKGKFMESYVPVIGYSNAEKYWAFFGAKKGKQGYRMKFYAALIKGKDLRSEEAYKKHAKENGASPNDINQHTHMRAIADLVFTVRENLEKAEAEKAEKGSKK